MWPKIIIVQNFLDFLDFDDENSFARTILCRGVSSIRDKSFLAQSHRVLISREDSIFNSTFSRSSVTAPPLLSPSDPLTKSVEIRGNDETHAFYQWTFDTISAKFLKIPRVPIRAPRIFRSAFACVQMLWKICQLWIVKRRKMFTWIWIEVASRDSKMMLAVFFFF